jgi:hypothetical protein
MFFPFLQIKIYILKCYELINFASQTPAGIKLKLTQLKCGDENPQIFRAEIKTAWLFKYAELVYRQAFDWKNLIVIIENFNWLNKRFTLPLRGHSLISEV